MDYSLLVGVRSRTLHEMGSFSQIKRHLEHKKVSFRSCKNYQCMPGHNAGLPEVTEVYCFGIVDFLTPYDTVATFVFSLTNLFLVF